MSANTSSVQQWIKRVVAAVAILGVGSLVGILALNPRPAEIESAVVVAADEATVRRSLDAYAARYAGIAQHYAARGEALEHSRDAYAARYTGLAEHYAGLGEALRRGRDAYAARYAGMAAFARQHTLSTQPAGRVTDAYAARYTGMAEHYSGMSHSSQRGMDAYAARCTGIAEHCGSTKR